MFKLRLSVVIIIMIVCAVSTACQPTTPSAAAPTVQPFPTITPGHTLRGVLPTPQGVLLDGSGLANPATAVALANRPTPTPDFRTCPAASGVDLPRNAPPTAREINAEILGYLSDGGDVNQLSPTLASWGILGEGSDGQTGQVRTDVDFTGEGSPEVVISYLAPEEGGVLLILGCADTRYAPRYQSTIGTITAPQIVQLGDMNRDGRPDILFTGQRCENVNENQPNAQFCSYQTQLITWQPDLGLFGTLTEAPILSTNPPTARDMDGDEVTEIIFRLDNPGTRESGPLRTGVNIYDWNGIVYVLSIVQLDPPAFRVQIIHEADRAFARSEMRPAAQAYELALNDTALRFWFDDEALWLESYILYRLLLAYAYIEDDRLLPTYQRIRDTYPDALNAPVYVEMSSAFWDGFQVTNNLNSACLEVLDVIAVRPDAVQLLNRYGSRAPSYTAEALCPF